MSKKNFWDDNLTNEERLELFLTFQQQALPKLKKRSLKRVIDKLKKENDIYYWIEQVLLLERRAFEVIGLKPLLRVRKKMTKQKNQSLIPHIDKIYWCETCGSKSGKCHPDSGYCFICDTDNWEPFSITTRR